MGFGKFSNGRVLGKTFKVPNGSYNVSWSIPETSNGDIDGVKRLEVTSGEIFVCDPCYVIGRGSHEDWIKWLEDNGYGDAVEDEQAFIISSMGGDGCYEVHLKLKKIE